MAKNSAANLLTSVDSLFTTQEERDIASQPRVQEIPIDQIDDFPNHPFKVRMDDNMIEMAESVKQHGILVPAIVRPKENGHYEMVAGHRRKLACTLIAKLQLPCIVRELTDEEATVIMVDSNLQREQLLPSEKAFAYKMKLDAMRRQAGRPSKENGATVLPHFSGKKSREILAEQAGESHEQVRKLIRLTELIPEVLDLVDNSVLKEKDKLQIALRPAVELSYLTQQEQHDLYETMTTEDCTPSHVQAMKMRKFSEEGRLNMDVIFSIMQEENFIACVCLSSPGSVFPVHGIHGNNPLFSKFADIYAVDQFPIGNGFAQCAFIQSPQFCGVTEGHQPIKRRIHRLTVFPKLITGQIQFVPPDNPVASYINRNTAELGRILLQTGKHGKFLKEGFDIV